MQQKNEKTLLFANTVGTIVTELRSDKNLSINKFAHEYDLDVGNTSRVADELDTTEQYVKNVMSKYRAKV